MKYTTSGNLEAIQTGVNTYHKHIYIFGIKLSTTGSATNSNQHPPQWITRCVGRISKP